MSRSRPSRFNRKAANLARLKRIEGQIRGLEGMVEAERSCPEVLTQISAVQEALRSVGRELMRDHLRGCVVSAARGRRAAAATAIDEIVDLLFRGAR